jgi:hypothetical protein
VVSEEKTIRLVQFFFGVIGAAVAIVFVQYFFEFSFAASETFAEAPWSVVAAIIITAGFGFAWIAPRLWEIEWMLSLLLAFSGLSALFVFFGAALLASGLGGPLMLAITVGLFVASSIPWFTLRRVVKGRAGRSDGQGHIDFLDGGHGRTELRFEGDVVAWLESTAATSGYREDGDATRYRSVAGTREELVAASRRRAALFVLGGLCAAACLIAFQSATFFRWTYVYPGF